MFVKLNQNLEIIEADENLLIKFELVQDDLLGVKFLDMVLNTVPNKVIDELKLHCRNGLNGSYILNIGNSENNLWLNARFKLDENSSKGNHFEVRFVHLDNLSVRNVKDMYALMNFEELTEFEQLKFMRLLKFYGLGTP